MHINLYSPSSKQNNMYWEVHIKLNKSPSQITNIAPNAGLKNSLQFNINSLMLTDVCQHTNPFHA